MAGHAGDGSAPRVRSAHLGCKEAAPTRLRRRCRGAMSHAPILVVDNHDSFVHTLVGYLHELGAETDLVEADAIVDAARAIPRLPRRARLPGRAPRRRRRLDRRRPRGGGCRHPAARRLPRPSGDRRGFGATVAHAPELMHGMTSLVEHDGSALYAGLPEPVHGDALPLARDRPRDGARRAGGHEPHRERRDHGRRAPHAHRSSGVQFHPESVLTEGGHRLLGNWLATVGIRGCRGPRRRAAPAPLTAVPRSGARSSS